MSAQQDMHDINLIQASMHRENWCTDHDNNNTNANDDNSRFRRVPQWCYPNQLKIQHEF